MKTHTLISSLIATMLIGVGFFGYASAQEYSFSEVNKHIYRIDDVIQNFPSVLAKNTSILVGHFAADQQDMYEIDSSKIGDLLGESETLEDFSQKIRIEIIKFLLEQGYSGFNDKPYQTGSFAIVEQSGDFKVLRNIEEDDGLDMLLKDRLQAFKHDFENLKEFEDYLPFKTIGITSGEYANLGTLFLFKNEQDLRDLGYELISWKTRINTDPEYRKHNIMTAFNNIGNVRLIMPDEIFSLGHELHYSASAGDGSKPYVEGYATVGGGVKLVYGGGLCGVGTAFYQGTLTNLALALLQYRAHSIYYRNLYEAEINGINITDPGLDATLYSPNFDLKVQNIRDYPIIIIFNFDGSDGSVEQVFTLSQAQDRGSFEYIGMYKKKGLKCFTWKINGEERTNCYGQVKNF